MREDLLERCVAYAEVLHAEETRTRAWILEQLEVRDLPRIQVSPLEGRLLALLALLADARRLLEVGTLGGYSTLWLVSLLPPDARIVTIERDPEHARLAREAFERAGETERIRLVEGDARDIVPRLSEGVGKGADPYDLVFLDADKAGYPDYLEMCRPLLRPGGLVLGDNAFWDGRVVEAVDEGGEGTADPDTVGIRTFNRRLAEDPAFDAVIIPVRDGLALGRFRG